MYMKNKKHLWEKGKLEKDTKDITEKEHLDKRTRLDMNHLDEKKN